MSAVTIFDYWDHPHFMKVRSDHTARAIENSIFLVTATYDMRSFIVDPTGAGDSFVGGMIGYLASAKGDVEKNLRRAIIHGTYQH